MVIDSKAPPDRLAALDGLRFFAALFVLWAHGLSVLFKSDPPVPAIGAIANVSGLGMTLFFVLSGFVIHFGYHHLGRPGQRGAVWAFVRARFARLYPLYVVVLALDVWGSRHSPVAFANAPHALLYHAPLVQAWRYGVLGNLSLIYQFAQYSGVAWSISVEVFFYLVYVALVRRLVAIDSARAHGLAGLAIFATGAAFLIAAESYIEPINGWAAVRFGPVADLSHGVQDSFFRWLVYFWPPAHLGEFLLGCLAANWYLRRPARPPDARARTVWLPAAVIVAIVGTHFFIYSRQIPVLGLNGSSLYAPLMAWLLWLCARGGHPIARWLGSGWRRTGGDSTYAMYLLHIPVLLAWATPTYPAGRLPWVMVSTKFALMAVLILTLARLVFVAFERPMRSLVRGQAPLSTTVAAMVTAVVTRPVLVGVLLLDVVALNALDARIVRWLSP